MENMNNVTKEARLVFNSGVCRALLKVGCQIIDIKPDRNNSEKTIFVFKNDEHFQKEFARINQEISEAKSQEVVG